MTYRLAFTSTNKKGQICSPHRYADGSYRAVRYEAGNPNWKAVTRSFPFTDDEMPAVMADPELYIRMSPINDPRSPALFRTVNISKRVD